MKKYPSIENINKLTVKKQMERRISGGRAAE
jgi:hypothetical protein